MSDNYSDKEWDFNLDQMKDLEQALAIERTKLERVETALSWQKTFGTSQLTHAQARLEEAEKMVDKLVEALEYAKKWANEEVPGYEWEKHESILTKARELRGKT